MKTETGASGDQAGGIFVAFAHAVEEGDHGLVFIAEGFVIHHRVAAGDQRMTCFYGIADAVLDAVGTDADFNTRQDAGGGKIGKAPLTGNILERRISVAIDGLPDFCKIPADFLINIL